MRLRWKVTEDTPYRHVDAGTVADVADDLAERLIAEGIAVPVKTKAEPRARSTKRADQD